MGIVVVTLVCGRDQRGVEVRWPGPVVDIDTGQLAQRDESFADLALGVVAVAESGRFLDLCIPGLLHDAPLFEITESNGLLTGLKC